MSAVVHTTTPLAVETPRDRLGGAVTRVGDLFVRQNLRLPNPRALKTDWSLAVDGVAAPARLSVADLRRLPAVTRRVVLECAGNGRALLGDHPGAPGTPWSVGAVACADWTGVPLRVVVALLGGVDPGLPYCTATGGDDEGRAPDRRPDRVERSVPADHALAEALLAWDLNGAPIPLVHGGPLRLIVPGYYAVNSVKFVRRLAFTAAESDADIQRCRYRLRTHPGRPPTLADPPAWLVRPKAVVTAADACGVRGVAWAGAGPVRRVEVTTDNGRSWQAANLDPPGDPAAWRPFHLPVALPAGPHGIAARATDAQGTTQPPAIAPNADGYANNGWLGLTLPVVLPHR